MLKAKYDWNSPIDEASRQYINQQRKEMTEKQDDRLYLIVGETGVGKSMLAFHLLEIYNPNLSMEYVVQERKDFADALKKVKDQFLAGEKNLYLWFDEADTDNLEQQARWNKRLFSMYMKLRKLAIMHIWCFPSLKALDRRFVEEKVRGVFFCYDKAKNRPRNYCFFTKKSILAMIDADIRLNIPNLKKARKKYAWYMGYYKDYTGVLRKAYDEKKNTSMSDAVDDFHEEFSGAPKHSGKKRTAEANTDNLSKGIHTPNTLAEVLGITPSAVRQRINTLIRHKKLKSEDIMSHNGNIELSPEQAQLVINDARKRGEV